MALDIGKKKYSDDSIWVEYEGVRLKIGRAQSTDFLSATESLERPHKRKIDKGTLSAKIRRDLNIRAIARAVLTDWDGVTDDGVAVPYSEELGCKALSYDPDLLEFIIDTSIENSNFAVEVEEKIVKKSVKKIVG